MCAMVNRLYSDPIVLSNKIAKQAIPLYPISSRAWIRLLNHSENTTYLVIDPETSARTILRVNRPGYHSKSELEAELEWMKTIREHTSIVVPEPIMGRNGEYVQVISLVGEEGYPYHCTMFSFLTGTAPDEANENNMVKYFKILGELTAILHKHARWWGEFHRVNRPTWDYESMLGNEARWGKWEDSFDITDERLNLFQKVSDTIRKRLTCFGKTPDRFGLIHADLRLSNLLVDDGHIKVIDFDDCGYGWFLYDLASALSFIEHKEYVPKLIESWLKGYEMICPLSQEEKKEIPTFVMLRRLILLAWLGSHSESDTAREIGADFTLKTEELARTYLNAFA